MESMEDVAEHCSKWLRAELPEKEGNFIRCGTGWFLRGKPTSDKLWKEKVKSEGGGGLKLRTKFYMEGLGWS
jgi:hypothetical protein